MNLNPEQSYRTAHPRGKAFDNGVTLILWS